jgi:hypothetical protein
MGSPPGLPSGLVNQEPLLQIEHLAADNRILRAHAPVRLRLSNAEQSTLVEIGKRLGRKGLEEMARVATPDTILAGFRSWWRRSSMAPSTGRTRVGQGPVRKWKG